MQHPLDVEDDGLAARASAGNHPGRAWGPGYLERAGRGGRPRRRRGRQRGEEEMKVTTIVGLCTWGPSREEPSYQ